MASLRMLLVLALAVAPAAAHAVFKAETEGLETIPMYTYKKACHQKLPLPTKTSLAQIPGAGMKPVEPNGEVLKDGFFEVDCVKDKLLNHGDAHGKNKHEYTLGDRAGVSIVRYSDVVPKEDAAPMTREVCFEFCRTVPDMGYFGLAHGRDCYCTPYYEAMAGDSSQCDSVCEGAPTTMCGGMTKSNIFGMHMCADTAQDLSSAADKSSSFLKYLGGLLSDASAYVDGLDESATTLQQTFGTAGDPEASNLLQGAKGAAGDMEKQVQALKKIDGALADHVSAAEGMAGKDLKGAEEMKQAEEAIEAMEEATSKGEAGAEELRNSLDAGTADGVSDDSAAASLAQYKTMPYFVDKDFEAAPSTCSGATVGSPIVGKSAGACAASCDVEVGTCVGFSYFAGAEPSVCVLLSKFTSATYYTKCEAKPSFLQAIKKTKAAADTQCYVKFQQFEGLSLKPDPSGKCDHCLKKAQKAERCFE